ncbi:MAG: BrnA antitoxin family protein [Actinobacteria bacterium]|nr:BrnA antitoxin family protein [Actinomycetota bacterium]MBU1943522.1 BrnA antitoxin family protein [Actinomycetota bacterium]MBU2686461.1 BrnA antitoxin family protein [Actinomycetota bacterium]
MPRALPEFEELDEELEFWRKHDVIEFVDFSDLGPFLRSSNKSIVVALRMEPVVREQTRRIADARGSKYQTLMREWIYDGLERSLRAQRGAKGAKSEIEVLTELVLGMSKDLEELKAGSGGLTGD